MMMPSHTYAHITCSRTYAPVINSTRLLSQYAFEASIILIYGFERCSSLSSAVTPANVTHNPFYDLHKAMGSVNVSLTEMTPMLEFYLGSNGVNGTLIDNLVHKIRIAENATQTMFNASSEFTSTSYIMAHFDVTDSDFVPSIVALTAFFIVFRVLAYLVLYFKSTPKK